MTTTADLIPIAMGVLNPFTGMLLDPIFAAAAMVLSVSMVGVTARPAAVPRPA